MKPGWTWPPSSWTLTLKQLKWKQSPRDSMIMAAPLPSGVLQNEHIFLPLTDLDYRKHHLKPSNTDLHMAHVGRKHILKTTRIWETHGNGWVVWFRSVVLKWFCFTIPREYQNSWSYKMSTKMYYGAVTSAKFLLNFYKQKKVHCSLTIG